MDSLIEAVSRHFWWIIAAVGGRLLFHSREAQAGRRHFWGRELPFELLIAVVMGLIAFSLCAYLDLTGPVSAGVISAVAYLGPRALDTLFERAMETGANILGKGGKL